MKPGPKPSDKMKRLEQFISDLTRENPNELFFTVEMVKNAGKGNKIGFQLFVSHKYGLGEKITVGRGRYKIPEEYMKFADKNWCGNFFAPNKNGENKK